MTIFRAVAAFLRTRALAKRLRTRDNIAAYQKLRLDQWRAMAAKTIPHFRNSRYNGALAEPLLDKARLMAKFADYNAAGVTAAAGWAIFEQRMPQPRGYFVGASTGTSGNRGLYVISDAERYEWLGTMLAKTLPRYPLETARIALVLPLNSALYRTVRAPGLKLEFFDLHAGLDAILPAVLAYGPDTVIAPPKVLRALAEAAEAPRLRRIFSGAEVLDPLDRAIIEARFGVTVREIYMATEGLLGVACAHGTLHLCEDSMHFEWEDVAGSDLKAPVISDFTRTTQAMCRYRMNDLLRLSSRPCPCGSPYQAVASIEGRADDLLSIGGTHTVTPDILRNAIVDSDRRIVDFRLRQTGPHDLELVLPADVPADAAMKAERALSDVLGSLGLRVETRLRQEVLTTDARKLRRVERIWRG